MTATPTAVGFTKAAEAFRSYCARNYDATLEYDLDSVALVDGFLFEAHEDLKGMNEHEAWDFLNHLCLAAGAFVGEVLVRRCGGVWKVNGDAQTLQNWVVAWGGNGAGTQTIPVFQTVLESLQVGPKHSLLSLVAPFLKTNGHLPRPAPGKKTPTAPHGRPAKVKAARAR